MDKIWQDAAWTDYLYWQTQDKKTLKKINRLIQDIEIKLHLPFVLRLELTDFQLHGYHCLQATVV